MARLLKRRVCVVATAILLSSALACSDPLSVDTPLLQTHHATYELELDDLQYLAADVDYTFTNETGATVYLVNCLGLFDVFLERWDGGKWVLAWSPAVPQCLSPPIIIEPEQTYEGRLSILSGCPASPLYPELDCDGPHGIYRIVWVDALSSYQDHLPFGAQIPHAYRVSNAFELVRG